MKGNIVGSVKPGKPPVRKYGLYVWPNLFGRADKSFFPVCLPWVTACAIHGKRSHTAFRFRLKGTAKEKIP